MRLPPSKTSKGAVENQLTFQASTLASDFAKAVNRQYYSDGIGAICEVVGTAATSVTVKLVAAATGGTNDGRIQDANGSINNDISPTEYIQPGMILGVGSAAGSGTISVTSISGTTIVVDDGDKTSSGGVLYIVDGSGGGAGTSEIQGMKAALSSSTGTSLYATVARSTYGWTPQISTTAGALTNKTQGTWHENNRTIRKEGRSGAEPLG